MKSKIKGLPFISYNRAEIKWSEALNCAGYGVVDCNIRVKFNGIYYCGRGTPRQAAKNVIKGITSTAYINNMNNRRLKEVCR